jgi:hypothetical protein
MGYPIAAGTTYSLTTYLKSPNLITGRNLFLPKGTVTIVARGSATGMQCSFTVGGVQIVDQMAIPYFGATGTLDASVHIVCNQAIAGGVAEFYLFNNSAGTLTTDYLVLFTPTK